MEKHKVDLPITSVIVYRQGAGIKRTGQISLFELKSQGFRLTNLPLILDDSSVRVQVSDPTKEYSLSLRGINIILELPDDLETLSSPEMDQLKDLYYNQSVLESEESCLSELINKYKNISQQQVEVEEKHIPSPIKGRMKLNNIILNQLENLTNEKRTIAIKRQKLEREILEIERNRQNLSNARERREQEIKKSIILDLDIQNDKEFLKENLELEIVLEYLIPGARWTPVYSLDFRKDYRKILISHRGMVAQKSGEDWSGAAIALSTANAWSWTDIPELKAMIIGKVKPPESKKGWREPAEGWQTLYSDFDNFKRVMAPEKESPCYGSVEPQQELLEDYEVNESEAPISMASEVCKSQSRVMSKKAMPPSPIRKKEYLGDLPLNSEPVMIKADYSDPKNIENWDFYRLFDYSSDQRNQLQLIDQRKRYTEMILSSGIPYSHDVGSLISQSIDEAQALYDLPLPDYCINPSSIDGYDYTFHSLGTVDLPSNGQFHMVPLDEYETDSEIIFISVPREDQQVYRKVRLCHKSKAPLLYGPCDVSIDNQYLLSSQIPETGESAFVDLGLGVEEGIRISRNTLFEEQKRGPMNGNLGLYHKITINLTNNLAYTVSLDIQERIPVAEKKNEKIKVQLLNSDPPCNKFSNKQQHLEGGYKWLFSLNPGESKELILEYTIEIPNNYEIIDGNRREN